MTDDTEKLLREALEWYADTDRYGYYVSFGQSIEPEDEKKEGVLADSGERARAALRGSTEAMGR